MAYSQSIKQLQRKLTEYFNLNNNEVSKELFVNKFNTLLDSQGRLARK